MTNLRHMTLALSLLLSASFVGAATQPFALAPLRNPQVHVNGTGLLDYLALQGEHIDPTRDQVDVGLFANGASNNSTFTVQVELSRRQDSTVIGFYNGHDPAPALMEIFPPGARQGWFAVFSFRTAPIRGVVNLFDENATFLGTRTYLGADRNATGIYSSRPEDILYSQDPRNPGGKPRVLFYRGTGWNAGSAWIAMETGNAADDDFDDSVMFFESVAPDATGTLTPIRHTSWGELKARFR